MRSKMADKSKRIDINYDYHAPFNHEIRILVKTLKPEKSYYH